ncbi:MAG: SpaA isopeptide-forming pilin-related protein [Peptoniphilus sp.]|nr:SpaA isopeptide-forming pilin-related protein [Peptoniphilus sp.]MDY3118222.1 SpaA isopeptide-forming pilin-related protein [Peptoniphilus sp.]
MLNLQKKLCKLVFAILLFSMVAFSVSAPARALAKAADTKSSTEVGSSKELSAKEKDGIQKKLTIDFSRGGKKEETAKRSVTIWRVSEGIRPEESGVRGAKSFDDVRDLLKNESDKALHSAYAFHASYTTDEEGKLNLTLSKGTYYVRVADKAGAVKFSPFVFVADPADKTAVIYPKGSSPESTGVELTKISTDRVPLPGAVFQLFRLEGDGRVPVKGPSGGVDFVTDAVGKIVISGLAPGKYVFVETKAPAGYRIKHAEVPFEVTDKKVQKLTVENYRDKVGGKKFRKVSSKGDAPLSGAQFLVTKKTEKGYMRMKKGGKDMVLTSGADGYFLADGLPDGDYYLWEVKAPAGYEPLSTSVKFIVSAESLKKNLVIRNNPQTSTPPGSLKSSKGSKASRDDKHVKIPKTGDVHLLLMSMGGLLSGLLGAKILKDND